MEIKKFPEDFIVEEIGTAIKYSLLEKLKDRLPEFLFKRKKYLHCTLVKRDYNVNRAISVIADKLKISRKRISYAGTKDKRALTSQKISIYKISRKEARNAKIKDILLKNFEYSNKEIAIGELKGNKFKIIIRDFSGAVKPIKEVRNYFGIQRFGAQRSINHKIGMAVLKNNLEGAVKILLVETGSESEEATSARKNLEKNWNIDGFKTALKEFPNYLGMEKAVLNHLVNYPRDYAGALRKIPKKLRIMFTHAVQSHLFNAYLSTFKKKIPKELPIVGYESKRIPKKMLEIMKKTGIKKEDFKCRIMPEMSSRGIYRKSMIKVNDMKAKLNGNVLVLEFSLGPGEYATTVIDELIKS